MQPLKFPLLLLKSFTRNYTPARLFSSGTDLQNAGSMASILKSRSVIRVRGADTVKFLQGLLTNDVRRFYEPPGEKASTLVTPNRSVVTEKPMYSAMLTPQGRFLYDMFLYRPPKGGEKLNRTGSGPGSTGEGSLELYLDVDASAVDELLDCFKRYRLRSKVEIENVAEEFSCWQRFGGSVSVKSSLEEPEAASVGWGAAADYAGMSASHGNHLGWQWFNDPRLDCLGFRGIFPATITPPLVEADKETDEQNYLLWRLEMGIAEGSIEIPKGEAIPLEYNLAGLNAISFDKGCYVGQEFIARTHHRGIIRKRLLPLKFVDDSGKELGQKVTPGSEVISTTSGKKAGIVTTALGCRGLGLLRLEEAFKAPGRLHIQECEDVKVEAIRPEWWPAEWLQGHHREDDATA